MKSRRQALNRSSLHRSQATSSTKNPGKTRGRPSILGKIGHDLRNIGQRPPVSWLPTPAIKFSGLARRMLVTLCQG